MWVVRINGVTGAKHSRVAARSGEFILAWQIGSRWLKRRLAECCNNVPSYNKVIDLRYGHLSQAESVLDLQRNKYILKRMFFQNYKCSYSTPPTPSMFSPLTCNTVVLFKAHNLPAQQSQHCPPVICCFHIVCHMPQSWSSSACCLLWVQAVPPSPTMCQFYSLQGDVM